MQSMLYVTPLMKNINIEWVLKKNLCSQIRFSLFFSLLLVAYSLFSTPPSRRPVTAEDSEWARQVGCFVFFYQLDKLHILSA